MTLRDRANWMAGDAGFDPDEVERYLADEADHDDRCPGDCHSCGGSAGVDVGIGIMPCMVCGGTGRCAGCSPEYLSARSAA